MRLKFLGFNYWSVAVYRDDKTRKLWCDISNLGEHAPAGYKGVSAKVASASARRILRLSICIP